jgi:YesN/AraC family two-component response regulator
VFMHLRDEICLFLSDIVMPAVNGIDMTASILQIAPQAKIFSCPGIATR